jgi:hypothetical protein
MRKTEIKGYNLSEDYKRLYDLIQEGHRIPAWILYKSRLYSNEDSDPIYDLVEVKLSYMSEDWDIGTRGRSFSAWEKSFESFEGVCKDLELRWIDLNENIK